MASWQIKGYVSDSDDDKDGFETFEFSLGVAEPRHQTQPESNTLEDFKGDTSDQGEGSGLRGDIETNDARLTRTLNDSRNVINGDNAQNQSIANHRERASEAAFVTTADKLEDSLNRGLSLVRDVLSTTAQQHSPDLLNDDDSPLSTLPSTPHVLQQSELDSTGNSATQTRHTPEIIVPRRILRERTIKQVMPYTTEQARYLKYCAESGIRPVRVVGAPSPIRKKVSDTGEDSQFEDESQDRASSAPDPMEMDFSGSRADYPHDHDSNLYSDVFEDLVDDELPDLNDLSNGRMQHRALWSKPVPNAIHLVHEASTTTGLNYDLVPSEDENSDSLRRRGRKNHQHTQQNSFPSPPQSTSSGSISELLRSQDSAKDHSPTGLPTPLISSALRPRKRLIIDDDTQSSPEGTTPARVASTPSDESSDEESNPSIMARVMQKRVKGVLPASWWSVGRAQQEMRASKRKIERIYPQKEQQAGVAQRKTNTLPRLIDQTQANFFHGLLSDEESDTEREETRKSSETHLSNASPPRISRSTPRFDTEASEVFDQDGFDPMLPIHERSHQRRLDLSDSRPAIGRKENRNSPVAIRRHDTTFIPKLNRPRKKVKRRMFANPISVLDAPDLQSSKRSQLPPFLRLAMKQITKKPNAPRTDATRKFFQLETEEDTQQLLHTFTSQHFVQHDPTHQKPSSNLSVPSTTGRRRKTLNTQIRTSNTPLSRATKKQSFSSDGRALNVQAVPSASNAAAAPANSIVVECGQPEANLLHLTRLNSLQPLPNRSGHGRLASHQSMMRAAYVEVPQLSAHRSVHPLNKFLATNARPSSPQELSPNVQRSTSTSKSNHFPVGKRKKQAPVKRQRFQQGVLASSSPNTSELERLIGTSSPQVRIVLEKEFAEHHGAWFQGSKSGISVSNAKTQRHFHVFLDVLRSYLSTALHLADDAQDIRELQSFLHRIIPNRGQIGARGQIGDKTFDVLEYDVLVARNVFELHTCLLALAPGSAPRPRVLEMKVNFSDAHHEICLVALAAWTEIFRCHHPYPAIVEGLASWLYAILSQLLERWKLAEIDARKEVAGSTYRIEEQVVRKVIEHNRSQAVQLLLEALSVVKQAMEGCATVMEARSLFDTSRYLSFLNTISRTPEMDPKVSQALFELTVSHRSLQWLLPNEYDYTTLLAGVREAIKALTSRSETLPTELYQTLAKAFFSVASTTVDRHERSWDNFVEPSSGDSLDIFLSENHLDVFKSLFYHYFVENYKSCYFLEFRPLILLHWVRMLLRCRDEDLACSLLTATIFRNERDSLSLSTLSTKFQSPAMDLQDGQVHSSLPEIRHATVMHVILHLQGQEDNSEAEWLAGGFDERDGMRMLRTIFTTLKETWMSLSAYPEQQDAYTILVHSALEAYQRRPRYDFTVDPWFFNSAMFPQPKNQSLIDILTCQKTSENDFDAEVRALFDAEVRHAQDYNRVQNLEIELQNALLLAEEYGESTSELYDEISRRQAAFIRDILCEFLSEGHANIVGMRATILRVLIHVVENFECRIDASKYTTQRNILESMLSVISAARTSFWSFNEGEKEMVYTLTCLVLGRAIDTLESLPEEFVSNVQFLCEDAAETNTAEGLSLLQMVMSVT